MNDPDITSRPLRRATPSLLAVLGATLIGLAATGTALADNPPTLAEALKARQAGTRMAPAARLEPRTDEQSQQSEELAQKWGIEVTSLRLTANDHMIDFRYRVLDAAKAASLFDRQTKPHLMHLKSGKVLSVPDTAKVGPLRNSYTPQAGKIYWMFFGNGGNLIKPGDKVTVVIGDFRASNLVVE